MYLLAVDTATEVCGVSLLSDGKIAAQLSLSRGNTHAKALLPAVDWLLRQNNLAVGQVDLFVVTQGPGSFTGLRIGISTTKGLATANKKPLIGVSSLKVLANQAIWNTKLICPMIDARRGEVYWALYERIDGRLVEKTAACVGPAVEAAANFADDCTVLGNGAQLYADSLQNHSKVPLTFVPDYLNALNPAVLGQLGYRQWTTGIQKDGYDIAPIYIRKSDAVRPAY